MKYNFASIAIFAVIFISVASDGFSGEEGLRLQGKLNAELAGLLGLEADTDSTETASDEIGEADEEQYMPQYVTSYEPEPEIANLNSAEAESVEESPDKEPNEKLALAYIPETEWRTPVLEGRALTIDMADKYPRGNFIERTVKNTAWGIGEELVFSIDYGFYNAGTATMSVIDEKIVNGGSCYHIRTTASSNDFISKFYKVTDTVNSFIDSKGVFSRRLEKHLREGKHTSDRTVDFYPDRYIALNTRDKYALVEIPLYVQDILSALYYLRTTELEVGKSKFVDVYADGKVYPLEIIIHKKETVEVPAGKFNCLMIEPILKSEGIFRQDGKLTVWLTDDEFKIPVKMKSKILIGSIGTNLVSYKSGIIK